MSSSFIQREYSRLFFYILLIYIGTIFYVFAAYYHLTMHDKWTFLKALMIAIPFVLIEYCFSLHGNYFMHHDLNYSTMDILILTICFYFINLWLMNYFVLKHKGGNIYKEILCFGLIICAFLLTTVIR